MNDFELALKKKINKVIIGYKKIKDDKRILEEENKKLKNTLTEKEEEIEVLINKYNRLQFVRGIESGGDEKEYALKQINNIVREINKCITLLNT